MNYFARLSFQDGSLYRYSQINFQALSKSHTENNITIKLKVPIWPAQGTHSRAF